MDKSREKTAITRLAEALQRRLRANIRSRVTGPRSCAENFCRNSAARGQYLPRFGAKSARGAAKSGNGSVKGNFTKKMGEVNKLNNKKS